VANTATDWQWIAAAVTGVSHRRMNVPCQDAFACRVVNGALVIAVADGAGSAACADEGSALAVAHLVDGVGNALAESIPNSVQAWQRLVRQVFTEARTAIKQQAAQASRSIRDYATTANLLIATDRQILAAAIGDGALVVQPPSGGLISLCPPQRGEYANTTYFLTQSSFLEQLTIALLPQPVNAVAVLTDGLLPLALSLTQNQPFAPFFTPLFAFVEHSTDQAAAQAQLAAFLDSPRVNGRTEDDKTLVLARRG
jgi:Protein phosphatase 2C